MTTTDAQPNLLPDPVTGEMISKSYSFIIVILVDRLLS
jgi:hypothetical protein